MSKANHLGTSPQRMLANMCLFKASGAIANTTASKVDALGTGTYLMDGLAYTAAAADEYVLSALAATDLPSSQANWVQPWGGSGFYVQPASSTVYYVIGFAYNAGTPTLKVVQGTYDSQVIPNTGGAVIGKSVIPDVPEVGFVPITVMKVVTAGSTFTPATTLLTGLATFKDVGILPVANTF